MTSQEAPDQATEKAAALAAYNSIVESAELGDIRLLGLDFRVKPEYYSARSDEEAFATTKRGYDSEFSQYFYDAESKLLGGQFTWTVAISQSRKKLLTFNATFLVIYENVPDVGEEHSKAFIKRVGRFATYPYVRSLVAQMSWESKVDIPILPVLK